MVQMKIQANSEAENAGERHQKSNCAYVLLSYGFRVILNYYIFIALCTSDEKYVSI